jgi:hypothetical protein
MFRRRDNTQNACARPMLIVFTKPMHPEPLENKRFRFPLSLPPLVSLANHFAAYYRPSHPTDPKSLCCRWPIHAHR